MKDEIFDYLINFGFNKENLNKIENENDDIYFISLNKIKENINFFCDKGLNNRDIINLIDDNPFNLTLSSKRKNAFDDIYVKKLNLSNEEIKYLWYLNNDMFTCSPLELDKIINYLIDEKKYSIKDVKDIIFTNPKMINKKLDDVIENL